jgi:hypothetical protein
MPLRAFRVCLAIAAALIGSFSVRAIAADPPARRVIDLWVVGDDGLTLRLRDALEEAFQAAPDFTLKGESDPQTLVVTIPKNVDWRKESGRTRVLFSVNFTSVDNRRLGSLRGSCWEDELATCAAQIIKNARAAAKKIR